MRRIDRFAAWYGFGAGIVILGNPSTTTPMWFLGVVLFICGAWQLSDDGKDKRAAG